MADLPKSIRVGYRDYAVVAWSTLEATAAQRYGETDRITGLIRVRADLNPQMAAEVLLHEVLHCCYEHGCADGGDEEKIVSLFGYQLTQVWRDNPDFVAFMSESLR